jgi:glutathione S-transferase
MAAEFAEFKFEKGFYEREVSWFDKEYLKKNPNATYPVLETKEGCIFESNAILRYIAN